MISMFLLVVENDLPGVKKLTDCSVSQPFQLPSEPPSSPISAFQLIAVADRPCCGAYVHLRC